MSENVFHKVEESFKLALQGKETTHNLLWWWGSLGYLSAYFVLEPMIVRADSYFLDALISAVGIIYFSWHFYVLKKCAPKKPKLSEEEKARLRLERRRELPKKIMRKLLLRESVTKWDPIFMALVIDVFCVARFMIYIVK
jgi:hypothetical protein